jgi:BASS family bile acid:Na+ symporter
MIRKILLDRNMMLVMAVLGGIFFPQLAGFLAPFTFWFLALVMLFSLSGLSFSSLLPLRTVIKPMLIGVFLNHIIFGILILLIAYLIFGFESELFIGFVIIAATPPGVAIIPFTVKLKGNLNYSIIGTFAAFLASVVFTPIIIGSFAAGAGVSPQELLRVMFWLIIVPFALSRILRHKAILPKVEKARGLVIDIGFSLIIYASVGINNHVFFSDFDVLFKVLSVLFLVMFIGSGLIKLLFSKQKSNEDIISTRLLFSIKSSGFAVVTAMSLFSGKTAVPATVMSVLVLVFFLSLVVENKILDKNKKP